MNTGDDDRVLFGRLPEEQYRTRIERFQEATKEIVNSRLHLRNWTPFKMILHTDTGEIERQYGKSFERLDRDYQELMDHFFKKIVIDGV